ncbi:MAG: hypothetical protein ACYC9L_16725 [Sulfuricaulis sp.]
MKKSITEISLPIACLLFASLLAGCGGGGGSSGGFNGARFNLSGSDNQGSHYTATMAFTNQGTQLVKGVNATHIRLDSSLTNTTTNAVITATQDLYFTTAYAPVLQVENPGNVQYTPTTVATLPASANIGDSGPLSTFAKSNGETEVDTWRLESAANGQAKLTFHVTTRNANVIVDEETNALTIDTAGTVFALMSQVTDPSGAVLTLSGNKQ